MVITFERVTKDQPVALLPGRFRRTHYISKHASVLGQRVDLRLCADGLAKHFPPPSPFDYPRQCLVIVEAEPSAIIATTPVKLSDTLRVVIPPDPEDRDRLWLRPRIRPWCEVDLYPETFTALARYAEAFKTDTLYIAVMYGKE